MGHFADLSSTIRKSTRKGVKTMMNNYMKLLMVTVLLVFGCTMSAWAVADPTYSIHVVSTYGADGRLISQHGTATGSYTDVDGNVVSYTQEMNYTVYPGGYAVLNSVTSHETSSFVDDSGIRHDVVTDRTTTYNLNATGMLTGGSFTSTTTDTKTDANGARVGTDVTVTNSTAAELRNGQLLFTGTTSTTTNKDKDGNPIGSTVTNTTTTYGDYSAGRWNATRTDMTSDYTGIDGTTKHTHIVREMTYSNGNLTGQRTVTYEGSGHKFVEGVGWGNYTFTGTETWTVINNIARRTDYTETQTSWTLTGGVTPPPAQTIADYVRSLYAAAGRSNMATQEAIDFLSQDVYNAILQSVGGDATQARNLLGQFINYSFANYNQLCTMFPESSRGTVSSRGWIAWANFVWSQIYGGSNSSLFR